MSDRCIDDNTLVAFAGNALSESERSDVEAHLAGCSACCAVLAHLADPVAFAATLPSDGDRDTDLAGPLATGARVGRYVVQSRIGEGGMGTVYVAHDPDLDRNVALKLLHRSVDGAAAGDALRARLMREAQAMARLRHPAVVTIHDVGAIDGKLFLAMELVDGVTLREWLARGKRTWREVVRAYVEAGRGLSAAHAAGIVHRDFKPDNVLISRRGEVRVTDFGLARLTGNDEGARPAGDVTDHAEAVDVRLTRSRAIVGTPAYMAPEQLHGGAVDARADVFAFCVSLYEGLYGSRPFAGRSLPEILAATEREVVAPPPAGSRVPAWLRRVLLMGLRADPAARWPSIDALLDALSAGTRGSRRVRWLAAGAVLAVALAGGFVVARGRGDHVSAPSLSPGVRPTVAVLALANEGESHDDDWLSTALEETIRGQLAAGGEVRAISGEEVARARASLGGAPGRDELARALHANVGADYVIEGTYALRGAPSSRAIRVDVALVKITTGARLTHFSDSTSLLRMNDLAIRATAELRHSLGVPDAPPAEVGALRAALPVNAEAARLYASALARMRALDMSGARGLLEQAASVEDGSATIHAALARALWTLGYASRALAEARRAFELSSPLGREDRLEIEASYRELSRDWARAIEIRRALFTFFPDDFERGLALAQLQVRAEKDPDAAATLDQLARMPPPFGDDPRIQLMRAEIAYDASDFKGELSLALAAASNAEHRGERTLFGLAKHWECVARASLGDVAGGLDACGAARAALHASGERGAEARSERYAAMLLSGVGRLDEAEAMLTELVSLYRDLDKQDALGAALESLAGVKWRRGDLQRSKELHEEAIAHRSLADGSAFAIGGILGNLANVQVELGDLDGARASLEKEAQLRREVASKEGEAETLLGLGWVAFLSGDAATARDSVSRGTAAATAIGRQEFAAWGNSVMAEILLDEGGFDEAAHLLKDAAAVLQADSSSDALVARGRYARALAGTRRVDEATAAIADALAAAGTTAIWGAAREARIDATAARASLSNGAARDAAIADLEALASETGAAGWMRLALEARLRLGLANLRAGRTGAREQLRALAADARAKGFGRVGHLAEAAVR